MDNAKNKKRVETNIKTPGRFGTGFLIVVLAFLAILILAGLIFGGWWCYKKYIRKSTQETGQPAQSPTAVSAKPQEENLTYTSDEFGFKLIMTPSWKDYQVKKQTIGGDFEVARFAFYLPTEQAGYSASEYPGYVNLFTISAYVAESWDEYKRTNPNYGTIGEEVGRNSLYVFVYSHFNGDPPDDIPVGTIRDMESIAKDIQIFAPIPASGSNSISSALDSASRSTAGYSPGRPAPDADYDSGSVLYWNCKYRYSLRYPAAWTNNGMTKNAWQTYLYGSGVTIKIESLGMPARQTLQNFADERTGYISGTKISSSAVDWGNNTTVIQTTFSRPDSMALHWVAGSRGMEVMVFGDNYNGESRNVRNVLGTLEVNADIPECKTQSSSSSSGSSAPKASKDCSFPNGDIEYWWDSAGQEARDCYISKYGYPNFQ